MDRDKWGLTALYLDDIESGQPSHLTRTADVSAWRWARYHIQGIFDGPVYIFGRYKGALK